MAIRNATVVIGPNASMSPGMALGFLGLMSVVSLGIAGLFAWQGFWPILPFAGLELGLLALALRVSLQRNKYREVIVFAGQQIRVECGMLGDGARLIAEWPVAATRVLLERGSNRNAPTRLLLSHAGRVLELGRCLTDQDRERLAARLRELINAAWRRGPEAGVDTASDAALAEHN